MFTKVMTAALNGINPFVVEVEVNATGQGDQTTVAIVGLPDAAVRESRERVRSAINGAGYRYPYGHSTVSLAPADVKKTGAGFDLPIALALIAATGKNLDPASLEGTLVIGELALDGIIRPVNGALAIAVHARELGYRRLICPAANAAEASVAEGVEVYGVSHLAEAVKFLDGLEPLTPAHCDVKGLFASAVSRFDNDFSSVKGHGMVKRGLEVAAAGGHNVLLIGPPGCGKTLMARCFAGILPQLCLDEALKVTQIHSIAGALPPGRPLVTQRPFRSPHHTISDAGLLGGTSNPRPGEISLAHHGVLFLDELPEYRRSTLEVMRQPMEAGEVTISRATGSCTFPASFMLFAAMNPCPCGHYGSSLRQCRCGSDQVQRYRSKISGPLLDRIDLHLEVSPVSEEELVKRPLGESSAQIRSRVEKARANQRRRFSDDSRTNATMNNAAVQEHCLLDDTGHKMMRRAISDLNLSARAFDRVLRMARTIADLEDQELIGAGHVAEAVNYRTLDRRLW